MGKMDSELWAPLGPGGRCSPGLTAVGKGRHTHTHTCTHSHLTQGGSHVACSREAGSALQTLDGTVAHGLGTRARSGVPLEGVRCSWAGARPLILFCLPCTDCLPAIPAYILFNNLSLLNYLLALPHHHPRLPLTCLFPQKQKMETTRKR